MRYPSGIRRPGVFEDCTLKVLFIHKTFFTEPLGIMYISACLKKRGHETDFFDIGLEDGVEDYVRETRPDIIGYSVMTGPHAEMFRLNASLKKIHRFFSVFGGPHPTYFPESVGSDGADAICRGEAEEAMAELADTMEAGKDPSAVPNFWVKSGGRIHRNDVRRLNEDLDSLPFPDRDLLARYPQYSRLAAMLLLTARGCPFNCSYCYNKALGELYRGKGKKLRRRSVGNVMDEVRAILSRGGVRIIHISDDTFVIDEAWLAEFANLYEPMAVPVTCYARPEFLTDRIAALLARIKCTGVHIGLETADEAMRTELLHRRQDNSLFADVSATLRRHGVPLVTQNMIGLPGERISGAFDTLRLNASIRPAFAAVSIFQPYPGTELARKAAEMGLVKRNDVEFPEFFWRKSVMDVEGVEEFENLAHLFPVAVEFPRLIPVVQRLVKLPRNPFYAVAGGIFKTIVFFLRLRYLNLGDTWRWAGRKTLRLG